MVSKEELSEKFKSLWAEIQTKLSTNYNIRITEENISKKTLGTLEDIGAEIEYSSKLHDTEMICVTSTCIVYYALCIVRKAILNEDRINALYVQLSSDFCAFYNIYIHFGPSCLPRANDRILTSISLDFDEKETELLYSNQLNVSDIPAFRIKNMTVEYSENTGGSRLLLDKKLQYGCLLDLQTLIEQALGGK